MSDHVASEQNGSNFLGTIATEQQVDEIGEGTDQLLRFPPHPTRSPKWPGLKPVGPAADPAGNVRTARSTSAGITGCVRGGKSSEGHRIGVKRMILHQKLEILLVRYRRRRPIAQNPDGCPNIAVLKFRIYCRKQCPFTPQRLLSARGTSPPQPPPPSREDSSAPEGDAPSSHLVVRSLIIFVILRRLPARAGWASMEDAKSSRATQAETERGVLQMSCRVDVNAWAQDWRAPLQMCLRSGPWVA